MRKLVNSGTTQEELISPGPGALWEHRNATIPVGIINEAANSARRHEAASLAPAVLARGAGAADPARRHEAASPKPAVLARGDDPPEPPDAPRNPHNCR